MRRALILGCVVFAAVPVPVLAASAGAQSGLQANKAIAQRDTRALLEQLRLPRGATRTYTQPPLPTLIPPKVTGENTVAVSRWWITNTAPDVVIAYVKAHRRAERGIYQLETEPPSTVIFGWTIDGAHLYSQQLQVTVATLADGRTGIMAQAQTKWMVPRPLNERVPSAVRSVAITLRIGVGPGGMKHQHTRRYVFERAATVSSIVNAFDAMPISQPSLFYSCPAMFAGMPSLTLQFRSSTGTMLAHASVRVYPGRNGGSGWIGCDPISFWIGTKQQSPLTSHTFVTRIARLIRADVS